MYAPPKEILEQYAKVLVNFALHHGKGLKKDEVVRVFTYIEGLPLAREVYACILKTGGHPILHIEDDDVEKIFYEQANKKQLSLFLDKMFKVRADTIDHSIAIYAEKSPLYLKDCDPSKINLNAKVHKPYRDWLDKKEDQGKFSWTLCSYATPGKAKEAGMSHKAYWDQIIQSCFLQEDDPVRKWKEVLKEISKIIEKLNKLPIDKIHLEAPHTNLWLTLGEKRKWCSGNGANIPSFEIFTSPDWRGTEGVIHFDQPLYTHGNLIKDVTLTFKNGKVIKASAKHNQKYLDKLIGQKNANKIGEFSLTDCRHSKITKFMADTLFDENFGGTFGNTHIAVGASYHETYTGDSSSMTDKKWESLGFNDSVEHKDMVSTFNRSVTAYLKDGTKKVIYKNGTFTI